MTARSQGAVAAAVAAMVSHGTSTGTSAVLRGGQRGELGLRHRARALVDLEVRPRLEAHHGRDEARRNGLPRVVVREDGVVVELPRDRDLVLRLLELALELLEVLARPQLRVVLGDGEEPPERRRQPTLGRRLLLDARGLLGRRAGLG